MIDSDILLSSRSLKSIIMTHEQLRAFSAVVELGSFRAAATSMFKTQSTISTAVKLLEQEFSFTLFDRTSYRPTLTPAGKAFYQQVRELLGSTAELEKLGHQLALGTPPTLTLSLSTMSVHPKHLGVLRRFTDHYPELELELSTQHLSGVLERLHKDKADLAIGPNRGLDQQYEFVEIYQIKLICVASPSFLELPKSGIATHDLLRNKKHVIIADSGTDTPFEHLNVIPSGQQWRVNDYSVKRALLIAGMGWSRMPLHMIEEDLSSGALVVLEVENFAWKTRVPIYLIRLKHKPLSRYATDFWDTMMHSVESSVT